MFTNNIIVHLVLLFILYTKNKMYHKGEETSAETVIKKNNNWFIHIIMINQI